MGRCPIERAQALAGIDFLPQRAPPPFVFEIPDNRLFDSAVERLDRPPAELTFDLARVYRITQVMPRPVGDKGDQRFVRAADRAQTVENGADSKHDVDVASLVPAADIILLADPAAGDEEIERARMILDIEPVANVRAGAIDRQRL